LAGRTPLWAHTVFFFRPWDRLLSPIMVSRSRSFRVQPFPSPFPLLPFFSLVQPFFPLGVWHFARFVLPKCERFWGARAHHTSHTIPPVVSSPHSSVIPSFSSFLAFFAQAPFFFSRYYPPLPAGGASSLLWSVYVSCDALCFGCQARRLTVLSIVSPFFLAWYVFYNPILSPFLCYLAQCGLFFMSICTASAIAEWSWAHLFGLFARTHMRVWHFIAFFQASHHPSFCMVVPP